MLPSQHKMRSVGKMTIGHEKHNLMLPTTMACSNESHCRFYKEKQQQKKARKNKVEEKKLNIIIVEVNQMT